MCLTVRIEKVHHRRGGSNVIYITGDTHAEFGRFSNKNLKMKVPNLDGQDYIIVCGDFGLCWEKNRTFDYWCKFFSEKSFTVLWVQGNHENYDMIAEYPIERWNGGNVRHIVRDKVILLERGQVFEIEGKKIFTFGGASSHDIQGGILDKNDSDYKDKLRKAYDLGLPFRINHVSWWKEELPDKKEMWEGLKNLASHDHKVDYVITHCTATGVMEEMEPGPVKLYQSDILTDYLQEIKEKIEYKHWYFGHYHRDEKINDKHTVLYHGLIALGEDVGGKRIPVLGRPKYHYDDIVQFSHMDTIKAGRVVIVDAYGTFEQNEEPSYDILVEEEKCLYKHVMESLIVV